MYDQKSVWIVFVFWVNKTVGGVIRQAGFFGRVAAPIIHKQGV